MKVKDRCTILSNRFFLFSCVYHNVAEDLFSCNQVVELEKCFNKFYP